MNRLNKILNSNKFEVYGGLAFLTVAFIAVIVLVFTMFDTDDASGNANSPQISKYVEHCVDAEPMDGKYTEDQARAFCTCAWDKLIGNSDNPEEDIEAITEADETRAALACMQE